MRSSKVVGLNLALRGKSRCSLCQDFLAHSEISQLIDRLEHQRTLPDLLSPPTNLIMPAPTTTLLIEGSFSELAEEFAQYIDTLRKEGSLQSEIAPLLQPIRQQEQSENESDPKQRDEVLKKIVVAASVLNSAPEKGECGEAPKNLRPAKKDNPLCDMKSAAQLLLSSCRD